MSRIPTSQLTDLALGKLPPEEALRLLERIERDAEASLELDRIAELAGFVDEHGRELFEGAPARERKWTIGKIRLRIPSIFGSPIPAFVTGVLAALLLGGALLIASMVTTSRYESLARISDEIPEYTVRGSGDQDLSEAMQMIEEEKFPEAIRLCERYMRIHPEEESLSYAGYVAGLASLLSARHTFLSLFPSYDRDQVMRGMDFLARSARVTPNPRIREEALWLRAKGFLMLREPGNAVNELEQVAALNGTKAARADALIGKIRGNRH